MEEYTEKRRIELLDVIIEVESSSLNPRETSDELIYLTETLSPMIKDITGISSIYDDPDTEDYDDQLDEVEKDTDKRKRGRNNTKPR